jgi:uncharacterized protein DUF2834
MAGFKDLTGKDRALCTCYALFAICDFLIMTPIAIVYIVQKHHAGIIGVVADFVREALSTPAGWFVYVDLTIAWIALAVFMVSEARRLGIRHVWAYIAAAPVTALGVSFPAFMFVRQVKIAAAAAITEIPREVSLYDH